MADDITVDDARGLLAHMTVEAARAHLSSLGRTDAAELIDKALAPAAPAEAPADAEAAAGAEAPAKRRGWSG